MAATEQANKWGIGSLLGWKGLMGDASRGVRITSIVFLIILSCSMVATQTNYLVIGSTHVIAVLAPIATGSLLFGVLPGTIIGTVAGLAEMLHATLLPLDAYEAYFAAPTNSVFLFALIGFVMGIVTIIRKLTDPTMTAGWASIICLLLFFFGLTLLTLGVIGEYLGNIVLSLNGTPQYIVREKVNLD